VHQAPLAPVSQEVFGKLTRNVTSDLARFIHAAHRLAQLSADFRVNGIGSSISYVARAIQDLADRPPDNRNKLSYFRGHLLHGGPSLKADFGNLGSGGFNKVADFLCSYDE
jgi:hypothetical protein